MPPRAVFNPFPGLRPFEPDEDHLFFGREREIDELLRRLRTTRFLQVVGSSGSGKSSLVRSGLIPALYSGFMVKAGSSWRVLIFRPGEDPIGHLAAALNSPDVLGTEGELASTNKILLESTLRRSTTGLVDAVRQARIPAHDNLLVVVDQFEELFRFRSSGRDGNSRDESVAFFKLLLEAATQDALPIYVVLTMRSDFIGDCMEFQGLPEAVNTGLYLVPRMTRDEVRSAITGPVAVGGGEIAQRLVLRLLNDLGDNHDQLPVLQHALMRTWGHWESHQPSGDSIDVADYEAVGTLEHALSLHAEEAFQETSFERGQQITEKMFKSLTDTFSDPRGIRRPTSVAELAAICEASEAEVIRVIEIFRQPGRSFLTPHAGVPLESKSVIDISHESLMRCWSRLIVWAEEERESARTYVRISQAAAWCIECSGGLWTDPQLETGLQWRSKNHPTAAWAERYDFNFAAAMQFLDDSEKAREAELNRERRRKLVLQSLSWTLAAAFAVALAALFVARNETTRAKQNLVLAQRAVNESLSSAGAEQGRETPDSPEMEQFRKQLLDKAKVFYLSFIQQDSKSERLAGEAAMGHSRIGDINRLLFLYDDAIKEYQEAITQFEALTARHPSNVASLQMLAYCHHWIAETLRLWLESDHKPSQYTAADAEKEYNIALTMQQELHRQAPADVTYRQHLARTYYNRGILYFNDRAYDKTEADFRQAIALLQPLAADTVVSSAEQSANQPKPSQDLARVYNNLGFLLRVENQPQKAIDFFQQAIRLHEGLITEDSNNREYRQELAQFHNNLAGALADQGQLELAEAENHQALHLIDELAEPNPSLSRARALVHRVHDRIVSEELRRMGTSRSAENLRRHPEFHVMYMNLAGSYAQIAKEYLRLDDLPEAESVIESMHRLLPNLTRQEQTDVSRSYDELKKELHDKSAKHK